MPRARWLVVGLLLLAALVGGVLNERGPFDAHTSLSYEQLLDDFGAGRIERIVQWRDQLEVIKGGQLLTVVVPAGRDLPDDLMQARRLGAWSFSQLPDTWLGIHTPAIPILIVVAAVLLWASALARYRRATSRPRRHHWPRAFRTG